MQFLRKRGGCAGIRPLLRSLKPVFPVDRLGVGGDHEITERLAPAAAVARGTGIGTWWRNACSQCHHRPAPRSSPDAGDEIKRPALVGRLPWSGVLIPSPAIVRCSGKWMAASVPWPGSLNRYRERRRRWRCAPRRIRTARCGDRNRTETTPSALPRAGPA